MMRYSVGLMMFMLLAGMTGGCQHLSGGAKPADPDQKTALMQERDQLQLELNDQKQQTARLQQELTTLRQFDDDKLAHMVYPDAIEFGRYTRPFDKDHDGIDDGLNVYLELKDRDGDSIKAGGAVTIELWDLAAEQGRQKIGQWDFPFNTLNQYWLGGLIAEHYKFIIEWPDGKTPEHNNLTLKLRFNCVLTGRTFEIQKLQTVSIRH